MANYNKKNDNYNKGNKGGKGGRGRNNKPGYKPRNETEILPKKEEQLNDSFGNDATTYFPDAKTAEDNVKLSPQIVLMTSELLEDGSCYPTVYAIGMNPSCGVSEYDFTNRSAKISPIDRAGNKLFTNLSAFTGRIPPYTPNDLSTLILAMQSFMEAAEWGRRAFGSVFKFDGLNRDIPRALIESMGIEYQDFVDKRETYLPQWNAIVNMADQVQIPDDIKVFSKSLRLYQNIYKENDTELSAYYVLNPDTVWVVDEESYEQGTILKTTPWCSNTDGYDPTNLGNVTIDGNVREAFRADHPIRKFSYYIGVFNTLTTRLVKSATFNLIYSDIVKYSSKSGAFKLWLPDLVFDSYLTPIVHEDKFNKLFHNFRYTGMPTGDLISDANGVIISTPSNDVYPDINSTGLVYNPAFFTYGAKCYSNNIATNWPTSPTTLRDYSSVVLDFDVNDPDINYRVDALMYKSAQLIDTLKGGTLTDVERHMCAGKINWVLPDHYISSIHVYFPSVCLCEPASPHVKYAYDTDYNNGWLTIDDDGNPNLTWAMYSKYFADMVGTWNSSTIVYYEMYGVQRTTTPVSTGMHGLYPWQSMDNAPIFDNNTNSIKATGVIPNCDYIFKRGGTFYGDVDNFMFVPAVKLRDVLRLTFQFMYTPTHLSSDK